MRMHTLNFFGKGSALIFESLVPENQFVKLTFLKKVDEEWEKPSMNQGHSILVHLKEASSISVANYGRSRTESRTQFIDDVNLFIEYCFVDGMLLETEDENNAIWRHKLESADSILFLKVLAHVVDEKIEVLGNYENTPKTEMEE